MAYTKMADPRISASSESSTAKCVIFKLNGRKMANDSSAFGIRPDDVIVIGERLL